jgi:hypothetical protein
MLLARVDLRDDDFVAVRVVEVGLSAGPIDNLHVARRDSSTVERIERVIEILDCEKDVRAPFACLSFDDEEPRAVIHLPHHLFGADQHIGGAAEELLVPALRCCQFTDRDTDEDRRDPHTHIVPVCGVSRWCSLTSFKVQNRPDDSECESDSIS